jgi:hypothetical protein
MSSDLAFLLGRIACDGVITRHGVSLPHPDPDHLAELQAIVQDQFGLAARIVHDQHRHVHALHVDSRPLRRWLLAGLGLESTAEAQVIPSCILRASQDEVAAFLRGLLLDGTLAADGARFVIPLASQRLIRQLQVLLLNYGVLAMVQPTRDSRWELAVQGDALQVLASLVGYVQIWQPGQPANPGAQQTPALPSHRQLQAITRLSPMATAGGSATATAYRAQPAALHTPDIAQKVYLEIQSVAAGFAEVFDLSVPGSHSFIANGIGNHNTCNFPPDATREDVGKAYMMAWELDCKGLTVYVTGSRQEVVLETQATASAKKEATQEATSNGKATTLEALDAAVLEPDKPAGGSNGHESANADPMTMPFDAKRPRPRHLHGTTYRRLSPLGTAYVTVNDTADGEPFEVFMNVGKAGSDVAAVSEALGRLISLVLRLPSSLTPTERLQQVVYQLNGIGGGRHLGFGPQRVRSLPDAIAQVLAEHLSEVEHAPQPAPASPVEQLALPMPKQIGDLCPDCGNSTLLNVEGCRKCHVCGYSEC